MPNEHQNRILSIVDAIRLRPELYIGSREQHWLLLLVRELFACPLGLRALRVVLDKGTFEMTSCSTPISVRPCSSSGQPYIVEVATRIQVPLDDPPSIAPPEYLNTLEQPATFQSDVFAPMGLAVANALSLRMTLASRQSGVITTVQFEKGYMVSGPVHQPDPEPDGIVVRLEPDPEILGTAQLRFHLVAMELQVVARTRHADVELIDRETGSIFRERAG